MQYIIKIVFLKLLGLSSKKWVMSQTLQEGVMWCVLPSWRGGNKSSKYFWPLAPTALKQLKPSGVLKHCGIWRAYIFYRKAISERYNYLSNFIFISSHPNLDFKIERWPNDESANVKKKGERKLGTFELFLWLIIWFWFKMNTGRWKFHRIKAKGMIIQNPLVQPTDSS